MAISKVNKFYIFAHLAIKDPLLKELQKIGLVEIIDIEKKTLFHDWSNIVEYENGNVSIELSKVRYCIDFLSNYQKEEKKGFNSFFHSKEIVDYNRFINITKELDYETLYQQCKELDSELNNLNLRKNKLITIEKELIGWQELDLDLSKISRLKYVNFLLGSIETNNLKVLKKEINTKIKFNEIQKIKEDKNSTKLLIIGLKENINEIKNISQKYNFEIYNYTHSFTGTPKQIIDEIENKLKETSSKKIKIEEEARKLAQKNELLFKIYDFLSTKKEKEDIELNLKRSDNTFAIKGWIQKKDIPLLQNKLKKHFKTFEIKFSEPKENEEVPVALENHKLVKPFEVITELYSLPNYFELDPTPILSFFYFIFFGFCLSDVGYGSVLALLSFLAINKLNLEENSKKFFRLLYYCGIAGIFGGVFVGSWFGDILNYLPSAFSSIRNILIQKFSLFDPTNNPIPLLILSLFLGIIQVYTGIILKFIHNVKKGRLLDGLMDQVSWIIFLTGIILVLLKGMLAPVFSNISWFLLLFGMIIIVLTQGRNNNNIFMRLGSGILALYNITGYFSDVLSYSRLFALGLATGIIATMFNMLATMANVPIVGIILTIIILFIGHVFNLLISGLSAFIHDARLQYVEFFTKFYQAGGIPFKPFSIKTKYTKVNVKQDKNE